MADWQQLTALTRGAPLTVTRVRLKETGIVVEGDFEPSPLALLPAEDAVFVMAFVRCHGSIRRMEEMFGVSYPTVKNRLNRIAAALPLVEQEIRPAPARGGVIEDLEAGRIDVEEALRRLGS